MHKSFMCSRESCRPNTFTYRGSYLWLHFIFSVLFKSAACQLIMLKVTFYFFLPTSPAIEYQISILMPNLFISIIDTVLAKPLHIHRAISLEYQAKCLLSPASFWYSGSLAVFKAQYSDDPCLFFHDLSWSRQLSALSSLAAICIPASAWEYWWAPEMIKIALFDLASDLI